MRRTSVSSSIFEPNSSPFNLHISEWTAIWWKWLHSIPRDTSPASDATGQFFNTAQSNPKVCFLAGTFGGCATRNCTIEYGKALFFPIITSIFSFILDPHLKTEQDLIREVTGDIDSVERLDLTVDEKPFLNLNQLRVRSEPFDDTIDGVKTKTVSDGYWAFLKPPKIGKHTIHFMGKNVDFFNEVTYHLVISDNLIQ